jgi:hypothetical protein
MVSFVSGSRSDPLTVGGAGSENGSYGSLSGSPT